MISNFSLFSLATIFVLQQADHVHSTMVSEWTEHNYASKEVKELAQWCLEKLKGDDEERSFEILNIKNIETQVVYGVNYKFTIDVLVKDLGNHETVRIK